MILIGRKNIIKRIDKKNGVPVKLWIFALSAVLLSAALVFYNFSDWPIKLAMIEMMADREKAYNQAIEIERYQADKSVFLAVEIQDKDWWEFFKAGRYRNGKIEWLTIKGAPAEESILSAMFVKLAGFDNPLIEIYGETHRSHGGYYLYEIKNNELSLLFSTLALDTLAVDFNPDIRWAPDNQEKYGHGNCGEVFSGGKLKANYDDINYDGRAEITLSGRQDIICEEYVPLRHADHFAEFNVASSPVKEVFFWNGEKYQPAAERAENKIAEEI